MADVAIGRPAEHEHRVNPWLVLVLVCMAQFMVILDATIVNVALPSIQADLKMSETDLQWIVNAYTLTFGGFLLLGGRAGDLAGRKKVFLIGLVIFTVASLLNGLAPSSGGAHPLPRPAGARRRPHRPCRPLDHHGDLLRGRRADEGDGRVGGDRGRRRSGRARARRHPRRGALVAVDLLREHPGRDRGVRRGAAQRAGVARRARAQELRHRRRGHRHGGPDRARVRDRQGAGEGLDVAAHGRLLRARGRCCSARSSSSRAARPSRSSACRSSASAPFAPRTWSCSWSRRGSSRCSSSTRSTCSACSATPRSRPGSRSSPSPPGSSSGPGSPSASCPSSVRARFRSIGMAMAIVGLLLFVRLEPGGSYVADFLPGVMLASIGMGLTFVPVTLIATQWDPDRRRRPRLRPLQHVAAGRRRARPRDPLDVRGEQDRGHAERARTRARAGRPGAGARRRLPRRLHRERRTHRASRWCSSRCSSGGATSSRSARASPSPSRPEPTRRACRSVDDVVMRVATPSDREAIDALMKEAATAHFPRFYDEPECSSAVRHIAVIDPLLLDDGTYYVLEADDAIVACGGWSRRGMLYTGSGSCRGRRPPDRPGDRAGARPRDVRAPRLVAAGPRASDPRALRGGCTRRGLHRARPHVDAARDAAVRLVRVREDRGRRHPAARRPQVAGVSMRKPLAAA